MNPLRVLALLSDPWFTSSLDSVVAFLAGALTAIFADPIRQRIFRPKPRLLFGLSNNFALNAPLTVGNPAKTVNGIILRGAVTNDGVTIAKKCRVYLVNIEKQNERTMAFDQTDFGDTLPIQWSSRLPPQFEPLNIPKDTIHYFEILDIYEGHSEFHPHVEFFPSRYSALVSEKGVFRFTLQLAGEGFEPEMMKVEFSWAGSFPTYTAKQVT
jgi:hypothetical protein